VEGLFLFLVWSRRQPVGEPSERRHAYVVSFHVTHHLDEAAHGYLHRVSFGRWWLLGFLPVRQKLGHRLLGAAAGAPCLKSPSGRVAARDFFDSPRP